MTTPDPNAPAPTAAPAPSPTPAPTAAPAPTPTGAPSPTPTGTPAADAGEIPAHLLGKDDKETIAKLKDAYKGARDALAQKGKDVPETADKYDLKVPDELKDKIFKPGADGKDPVFEALKPTLHKLGLSNTAASELTVALYQEVAKMAAAPADGAPVADFAFKELGGADKAKPIQEGTNAWITGLEQGKKIDAKAAAEMRLLTQYGEGLHLVNTLRTLSGEKPIPAQLQGNPQGGLTKAEIDARVADPRYWKQGVKSDDFINETTRLYGEFYAKNSAA
jgi:hypothetical protein